MSETPRQARPTAHKLVPVRKAAEMLGLSYERFNEIAGDVPRFRIGRRRFVLADEVERLREERKNLRAR